MTFDFGRTTHATQAPLYARVRDELERLAVSRALDDRSPLPSEAELSNVFDVSRGTLRRAVAELAADGLLRVEQGRGTFVDPEEQIRRRVWAQLRRVARSDSRFDLDLRYFIPTSKGGKGVTRGSYLSTFGAKPWCFTSLRTTTSRT